MQLARGSSGGGGGGGRSSSHSSGRGSSHRSLGSSSYSRSSRGSSGGGYYRSSPPSHYGGHRPPPPLPPRHHHHHYYHDGPYYRSPRESLASTIAAWVFIIIVLVMAFAINGGFGPGSRITPSTIERTPLESHLVNRTAFIEDTTGKMIGSKSKAENGMKDFYNKTGVQPYLYVTDNVYGKENPTTSEADKFMNEIYDQTFNDEGHLFVLYMYKPNSDDDVFCLTGNAAEMVMDEEARDILLDYFEAYYFDDSLTNDEYISKVFEKAGDRIMEKTTPFWVKPAIVIGVGVVLFILFKFFIFKKKQDNIEAAQTERIINTPVEKIGTDDVMEDLKDKYDDSDS